MGHIKIVMGFGWRYLRQYWLRLSAGVLLGLIFGLSNASFIWATKTLIERFKTPEEQAAFVEAPSKKPPIGAPKAVAELTSEIKARTTATMEVWLPRAGRALDWRQVLGVFLLLPVLVAIRGSAEYASNYCMGWVSERVINDIRQDVLRKLFTLSLDFFNRSTTGDLLTRINVDTAKLLRCLKSGAGDLIKEPITMISVLAAMWWINWELTLFALVLIPLCMFPLLVLGKKVRKASKAGRTAEISQANQLVELFTSMRVAKAYNLEGEQTARFRHLSSRLIHHGMKGVQAKEMVNPIIEVISMIGLSGLILYIFKTQTSIGDFVAFLTGMMLFFLPIKKLAAVHVQFEQASFGVIRLRDIMDEQPTVREPANPKPLPQFRSEIQFRNVTFAYTDQPVLQNFNLTIPYGAKIGIAGRSGSGKSTIINLLFRFYDPLQGQITIDGVDLREVTFHDLRQEMALVSQDVVLFDQTVAENIACGRPGATEAEIEAAAKAAYAHEFIIAMPQGYHTRVGERGVTLSGGQRQRISIARAFVRDAPILVLDEAASSLDSESEAEVHKAIDALSENRTVISVAHRLSTLANSDQILVIDAGGQIVEQGGFNELLERGQVFAAMARRQGILVAPLS
jgi:subfamily B ATP-binding cassette protein MsbA